MLVLALLRPMLGDLLLVVMHETRIWTWRHYLFLFSTSYVLSYVFEFRTLKFELGTILECVQGIVFHFTILHRNMKYGFMECQMLCYKLSLINFYEMI